MRNYAQSEKLIIHLGEKLSDDGTIDRKPGGTIRYQKVVLWDIPARQEVMGNYPCSTRLWESTDESATF